MTSVCFLRFQSWATQNTTSITTFKKPKLFFQVNTMKGEGWASSSSVATTIIMLTMPLQVLQSTYNSELVIQCSHSGKEVYHLQSIKSRCGGIPDLRCFVGQLLQLALEYSLYEIQGNSERCKKKSYQKIAIGDHLLGLLYSIPLYFSYLKFFSPLLYRFISTTY